MSKNSSIWNNSVKHKHAVKCKYGLIVKNISISSYSVYSIQFSISMLLVLFNPYIGPYHRALSGEGVLRIPQSSSTAETSPLFSVISSGVLSLCRGAVSVFYSLSWLGNTQS